MRIYDQNPTGMSAAESGRSQETQQTGRTEGQPAAATSRGSSDQVELSGMLRSLSRAMSTYSEGRSAKVQALAARYQNGTYQADSLATSRVLVAEALTGGKG